MAEKNKEILKIIETCENDLNHNTNDLSMNLNGVLDAAVMGGVAKYREAFFDGTYLGEYPQEERIVPSFRKALRDQITIAKKGLAVYEQYCPEQLQPHVEHLQGCYVKMQADLQDLISE